MSAGAENWVRVAAASELAEGQMKALRLGDRDIALYCVDGAYFATENICTHEYARLTDGWLEDGEIECPLHAGKFDVRSGKGLCAPIDKDLETFPVRVEGADLLLRLPS